MCVYNLTIELYTEFMVTDAFQYGFGAICKNYGFSPVPQEDFVVLVCSAKTASGNIFPIVYI